jgi:hypothetical protein
MNARVSSARSQIGAPPMDGEARRAYEVARAELTQGLSPERLASLDDLERDLARQQQLREQVRGANGFRSEIETQTQMAENHGTYMPHTPNGLLSLGIRIWRLMQGAMTRGQAEQLARIMLDPNATADLLEAAARRQATGETIQRAVRRATPAATVTATQEQARP